MQTGRMKATTVVLRECRRNAMRRFFFVKVQICEKRTILAVLDSQLPRGATKEVVKR